MPKIICNNYLQNLLICRKFYNACNCYLYVANVCVLESQAHYFMREDGSLEVFSLRPDDTASYACTAINSVGSAERRMALFVQSEYVS